MDWAMLGLMLGWIGIVAGAAWRFGKVEQGITELQKADARLRVDIQQLDQRLTAEISEVRLEVREVRRDVQRILERMPPPAD